LQNEHKEAIADLVIGHRGSIRDLKYCHVTNGEEEASSAIVHRASMTQLFIQ